MMKISFYISSHFATWLVDAEMAFAQYISLKVNQLLQRDDCLTGFASLGKLIRFMNILSEKHSLAGNIYIYSDATSGMTRNVKGLKLMFAEV